MLPTLCASVYPLPVRPGTYPGDRASFVTVNGASNLRRRWGRLSPWAPSVTQTDRQTGPGRAGPGRALWRLAGLRLGMFSGNDKTSQLPGKRGEVVGVAGAFAGMATGVVLRDGAGWVLLIQEKPALLHYPPPPPTPQKPKAGACCWKPRQAVGRN